MINSDSGLQVPAESLAAAHDRASTVSSAKAAVGRGRWYALALLSFAYGIHSLDRSIVSVVIEPIKSEFALNDRAVGLLAGLAHSIAFALASVPLGWLIDRVPRVRLLALLLTVWSGFTAACAVPNQYLALVLLRSGVGAAEAGGAPACMSLLSDLFKKTERSTAIGILYLSPAFGMAASFLIGGLVASHYGWRAAFLIAGAPGLLLALIMFLTMREPARVEQPTQEGERQLGSQRGLFSSFRYIFGSPALRHLLAAVGISALVMTALWTWAASLLIRIHGVSLSHAGLIVAIAAGGCQGAGSIVSGRLADKLSRGVMRRLCLLPVTCAFLSVPIGLVAVLAPTLAVAIGGLMVLAFVFTAWIAPTYSIAMGLARPEYRGSTMATIQLIAILVGAGGGPYLVGLFSDLIGGAQSLRWALAIVICFNFWAAFHFIRLSRLIRE